jgi:peptide/nickel transport system permease protein
MPKILTYTLPLLALMLILLLSGMSFLAALQILGLILVISGIFYLLPIWGIRKWWASYKLKKPFQNDQTEKSLTKFIANATALFGVLTITYALLIALFGYWIAPDSTEKANRRSPEIARSEMGFEMDFLLERLNRKEQKTSLWTQLWKGRQSNYREYPMLSYEIIGDSVEIEYYRGEELDSEKRRFDLINLVYARSFSEDERIEVERDDLLKELEKNNFVHRKFLFGVDLEGRDYLSRIIIGTRISIAVGFLAVGVALLIGLILGAVAGFFRGWVDDLIMWFINIFWSIPTLLLVFPIAFAFGMKPWTIYLAVGLTMWVDIARIVRGQVLSVREMEYVEAARSLGYGNMRTIFLHILPNITGPVIVITAANFAYAILIEAGLSFLGIGAQPPTPSWGQMIAKNKDLMAYGDPHLALIPGFAIVLLVLSFFLIGNGLRDALDAKTRVDH